MADLTKISLEANASRDISVSKKSLQTFLHASKTPCFL